jgi:CRISPR/Cas system CSM-associated protein Csm3 (group 7 of RAMP superfamily)
MRKDNTNPVTRRIVVKAECEFSSPALIGGGFDENTDRDILRDAAGNPFLPGSSVAGALRSLCPQAEAFFNKDRISPLAVFDSSLSGAEVIELDGVSLERDNRVARETAKYDYEAISAGAKFTVRLMLTVRKDDASANLEGKLIQVISAIKSGQLAFGAKTRRGFGLVACLSVMKREFDLAAGNVDILNEWLDFDWNTDTGWTKPEFCEFVGETEVLNVKLKLEGSIMIRDTRNIYEDLAAREKAPDYKHISVGGKPVILGTFWAGALSSGLYRLLKPTFKDKIGKYLKNVFGYDPEEDGGRKTDEERILSASKVVFGMSVLQAVNPQEDGYRNITRVKIDRFTGGAADGALFSEKPWFGGKTSLEIRHPKGDGAIKELILLGLEALDKGIIQVGGEASVGRGFFKATEINGESPGNILGKQKQSLIAAIEKAGGAK